MAKYLAIGTQCDYGIYRDSP